MERADVERLLAGWGQWARDDVGGPRVRIRAGSAEGSFVAAAGDIYVVDRRPRQAMITDELALQVDLAVGSADYQFTMILLDVFVRGATPVAAGGQLRLDAAVRVVADGLAGLPDRARRRDPPPVGGVGAGAHLRRLGAPQAP